MFLKITKIKKEGVITMYAKIAQSYRERNAVKSKVIFNLGPVKSKEDLKKFEQILNSLKGGENFVKEKEVIIGNSKEYGVTYTTNKLLEKYKIHEVLQKELSDNKAEFRIYETIKALIVNRLIRPSSDLSAYDWICEDYSENFNIKEHHIYRALDYLIVKKNRIEKALFENLKNLLNLNTELVHYDLTSTYFEGAKCEIAFYGYSRDHRKDRKQVVIGLAIIDGIPIYHEIYEGNTVDKSALNELVKNMKEKFELKNLIVVADRGIITEDNLDLLENQEYKYILGVQRRNNKIAEELLVKNIDSKEKHFAKEIRKDTIKKDEKEITRRYILCLNSQTKKERLENLKNIKKKKEKSLKELQSRYEKSLKSKKGKKITKESLINQAFKILGKNKRLFDVKLVDNGLKFYLNKENYRYEKKIAGKFLLVTNTDKNPKEIMKTYKELQIVENAFDEGKNFLYVRPVFHWKERRVRAHIFICILSLLIESIIERFSKESARETLKKLKRIYVVKTKIGDKTRKKLTIEPLIKAKRIFKELKIPEPIMIM